VRAEPGRNFLSGAGSPAEWGHGERAEFVVELFIVRVVVGFVFRVGRVVRIWIGFVVWRVWPDGASACGQ
jgi:hypothetical protein